MAAAKHRVGGSAMMLSKGVGIRAGGKPVSMYQRPERPGNHWRDCLEYLVGCAAPASCENIALPGAEAARSSRARKQHTQADLKRS